MNARSALLVFFLCGVVLGNRAGAVDTADLLESLLADQRQPRVLNSDDIVLNPTDPQPLFAPTGDFDQDGVDDVAVSGIYGLEEGPDRYFLLVAAAHTNPVRYDILFYDDFDKPVFLHQPGTTGEFDPGTQAFSITFCASCTEGEDFVWNPKKKALERKPWEKRRRRYRPIVRQPDLVPDDAKADQALHVVGALPDVIGFVEKVKKKKGQLGTAARVPQRFPEKTDWVEIDLYEKKGDKKEMYDTFVVDVASKIVVRRGKKLSSGGEVLGTSR